LLENGASGTLGAAVPLLAMAAVIRELENALEASASEKLARNCPAARSHAPAGAIGQAGRIARKIATEDLLSAKDCAQAKEPAKELMSARNRAILTLAQFSKTGQNGQSVPSRAAQAGLQIRIANSLY